MSTSNDASHWARAIQERISEAIRVHGRCALPFSGGLASCLLLHLAEPKKDQITVVTLDTGAEFRHVREFANRVLSGWNRKVVRTDIRSRLENVALPSHVFALVELLKSPVELGEIKTTDGKRIISSFDCCCHNRGFPGGQAVKELKLRAVISDQFGGDWNDPLQKYTLDGVERVSPLWGHTQSEIQEMISALGVELPDHYPEFDAPHGCSICPAALTPTRQSWMANLYPDELATAGALNFEEAQAVREAIARQNTNVAKVFHFEGKES